MNKIIKIAFDVDDTITTNPQLFSILTQSLIKNNVIVYIISDYDEYFRQQRIQELANFNIYYDYFIITKNKEQFCKDNDISYMFDDEIDYFKNSKLQNINIINFN
jgi:hypothetical protein